MMAGDEVYGDDVTSGMFSAGDEAQELAEDRLAFRSFDGAIEVQTGQGDNCVFLVLRPGTGVVLSADEAAALGRGLLRRAEYAKERYTDAGYTEAEARLLDGNR